MFAAGAGTCLNKLPHGGIALAFCKFCGAQFRTGDVLCVDCGTPARQGDTSDDSEVKVAESQATGSAVATAAQASAFTAVTATTLASGVERRSEPRHAASHIVRPHRVAGMLAYCTIIPPILFLLLPPFKRKTFIRFHSFQSLFTLAVLIIAGLVLGPLIDVLPVLALLLWGLLILLAIALWLLLLVKACQGEMFKLPIVGEWAERWA
jgi:uncharacterized membrane protein